MSAVLNISIRAAFLLLVLCAILMTQTLTAAAQGIDLGANIALETSPDEPIPHSPVTVTLNAYTLNLNGASISWFVDGSEVSSARNLREITLEMGPLGSKQTVRATITPAGGSSVSVSKTLTATEIDIILEANTSVPDFYQGRALPIGDELVRATALIHTGTTLDPDSLYYTWTLGTKVLSGGPVIGNDSILFTMPKSATNLFVTIADRNGNKLSTKGVRVSAASPELHFYEENPLRGQSRNAIQGSLALRENEVSIKAEPYYIAKNIYQLSPKSEWTINGRTVSNTNTNPLLLTLRATEGAGEAAIGFELVNTRSFLQYVKERFMVRFETI